MLALLPLALSLFPELVKAVAGDTAGKVAEAASSAVATLTGTDDPALAQQRINEDPAVAAQIRVRLAELAIEQERMLRKAELDMFQATVADVANARAQTIALAQAGSRVAWAAPIVSVLILATFALLAAVVLFRSVPAGSETLANMLLGGVLTFVGAVVNYWLGSSSGSAQKTDLLARSSQQK